MSESIAEVTSRQVGGTHYATMGLSPFEFAHRNGWDSTAFSILKYVSRYRNKDGLKDLYKARHIVDIRQTLMASFSRPLVLADSAQIVTMGFYIHENGINVEDGTALMALDAWVRGLSSSTVTASTIDFLIAQQKALAISA